MDNYYLDLPSNIICKKHIFNALNQYWNEDPDSIFNLPVQEKNIKNIIIPLKLVEVELPNWAHFCGINKCILLPEEVVDDISNPNWAKCDWWLGGFIMLEGWHERVYESQYGPIHSYSFKLKNWDTRAWDFAWVNRIGIFLSTWSKKNRGIGIDKNFLKGTFLMSHDVDALDKTLAIKSKQFVFNLFNSINYFLKLDFLNFSNKIKNGLNFLFIKDDWFKLNEILDLELEHGIKSQFNFYADNRPKNFKRWLFDPSYKLNDKRLRSFNEILKLNNFNIGLHPSFDSFDNENLIKNQLKSLSNSFDYKIVNCRQHWLRFSWDKTWHVQEKAGLECDSTIMFNDRPGFRVSASLKYKPWNCHNSKEHKISSIPSVIMDSHIYDYNNYKDSEIEQKIKIWIDEVNFVGGYSSVLWHPHTIGKNYGWKNGFIILLNLINKK